MLRIAAIIRARYLLRIAVVGCLYFRYNSCINAVDEHTNRNTSGLYGEHPILLEFGPVHS